MARRTLSSFLLLLIAVAFIGFTLFHFSSIFNASRTPNIGINPDLLTAHKAPSEHEQQTHELLPPATPQRHKHKAASRPTPQAHTFLYPSTPPKLTIIAIWNPSPSEPIYLPNFFASVAANPSIDLLFIKYDRHQSGQSCHTLYAPHVSNVREVCLTFEEYWELHAGFLCERWGGCSRMQKYLLVKKLHERSSGDRVNSYFRPFRAAVFKQWIHPQTKIWGWCDMDNILGSFERNFPWDIAENYDLVFPGPPIDFGDEMLMFLPGHLAFFKHAGHVVDEFMRFPNLRDLDGYLHLPWVSSDTEECEYSHFAFTATRLTFLRFPGIVHSRYHLSSINNGVYSIENEDLWNKSSATTNPSNTHLRAALINALDDHKTTWEEKPTFSEAGREYVVDFQVGAFQWFLWFPKKYAVHFVAEREKMLGYPYKRYVSRRTPFGPIYDRTEPYRGLVTIPPNAYSETSEEDSIPMRAFDMLYNHFQVEKYAKWWALPDRALASHELLFVDRVQGVQLWDSTGSILFEATV